MGTVIRYIGYLITSFLMWIGWLPILIWKFKAYEIFNLYREYYPDDPVFCIKSTFNFYKYYFTADTLEFSAVSGLLKNLFWGLVIYFILLIILSLYRKACYGEFMENFGFTSRQDRKMLKEAEAEEKAAYKDLFKKETPADRQFRNF